VTLDSRDINSSHPIFPSGFDFDELVPYNEPLPLVQQPDNTVANLPEEQAKAILHDERTWNPMRTVGLAAKHCNLQSGAIAAGNFIALSAFKTGTFRIIYNLSAAGFIVISKTPTANGPTTVVTTPVGPGQFPLPFGMSITIPTRDELWLVNPAGAAADVIYAIVDLFD
jgi:hypothetical protein